MKWPSLLLATGLALSATTTAPGQEKPWFPPTPRSGLVDEIGALSESEAAELRGMLKEALQRDDVRLGVFILKETPPVSPAELVKAVVARQKRCWFRGLICLPADKPGSPVVGYDGPGTADFPVERLRQAMATVRTKASQEAATGPQVLRYTADLLDELHLLRVTYPPMPTTWAGQAAAWAGRHPTLVWGLSMCALALLVTILWAWRRRPSGLRFPVMPMPARLGGPYAGGSRVSADFDAATVARSRERARK